MADANRKVYVYNTSGGILGSWTAGTLSSTAQVEGITTNGTDVWIVDNKTDKVFKYTAAAGLLSGSLNSSSSFSLNRSNSNAKGIVTDGTSIWVINDSTTDKVFKYSMSGTLLGSWTIDAANSSPTGLTIDPSNVSNIWTVDSGTKKVYQYTAAASLISGSQSAAATFALAAGNSNPQDIADPPFGLDSVSMPVSSVANIPSPMPSLDRPSTDVAMTSLHRIRTTARNADDFMSTLGHGSQLPQAPVSPARTIPTITSKSIHLSERDEFEIEDSISDLIDQISKNLCINNNQLAHRVVG